MLQWDLCNKKKIIRNIVNATLNASLHCPQQHDLQHPNPRLLFPLYLIVYVDRNMENIFVGKKSDGANGNIIHQELYFLLEGYIYNIEHRWWEGKQDAVIWKKIVANIYLYHIASCRRNFILEVVLTNTFEGLEYAAISRPLPIIRGRAPFKLKISQLSSKCDNKLFRIKFSTLHMQRYSFLEAYSKPIRCISRSRTVRPLGPTKRASSATANEIDMLSNGQGFVSTDKVNSRGHSVCLHTPMFPKIEGGMVEVVEAPKIASQNKNARKVVVSKEAQNVIGTDSSTSNYDSFDSGSSWSGSEGDDGIETFSDAVVFRYCLDSTYDRSKFLRGASLTVNKDDLVKLADRVSLYSGCSHHRNQILMSKRLFREGADTWNMISKNNERALWSSAIPEIITKFTNIVHSVRRGLSEQDLEVLRGIAGCGEDIGRDEFDRLWCWLYLVVVSLSRERIKKLWDCTAPRWIEGLITTEEAENALRSSRELLKEAGTFVLRFPITRSWPHPDAGSLVVNYIGSDSSIHHRLLSLDSSDASAEKLQDLLLQEPELSQLG
ncbi:hypothetical protein ACJX0J_022963, partial [Zea mays]